MKVLVLGGNGLFGRKTVINLVKDPEVETVSGPDEGRGMKKIVVRIAEKD